MTPDAHDSAPGRTQPPRIDPEVAATSGVRRATGLRASRGIILGVLISLALWAGILIGIAILVAWRW